MNKPVPFISQQLGRRLMLVCFYPRYLLAILLLLFTTTSWAHCSKTPLVWGWVDWPPFIYQDQQQQLNGFDYHLVTQTFKQANCELTLTSQQIPWRRQIAWIEAGKLDFITGAAKTAEREQYAYFSEPYRSEFVTIFVRKQDQHRYKIKQLKDLAAQNFKGLGYNNGTYYGAEFNRMKKQADFRKLLQSDNEIANFKRLLNHRLDGVIIDQAAGLAFLNQIGENDNIVPMGEFKITTGTIHIMFSKKTVSPETVEQFNQALRKLKASPNFEPSLDKYFNSMQRPI